MAVYSKFWPISVVLSNQTVQLVRNFGKLLQKTTVKSWKCKKNVLDLRWIYLNYLLIVLYITVLLSALFYYCWCEINMLSSELLGLVRFTMKYFYLLTYIHHSTYLVFFKDFLKIWNQNQKCQFKQFKMQWSFICLS